MPILTTKLHMPTSASNAVQRPRLFQDLNAGRECKLTLVSAPAGFGKTTVITSWLETQAQAVAWLALDENDSDVARFVLYLISSLQTINPNIGQGILPALASPQTLSLDLILTQLVNDIAQMPDDFIFVLDDYHTIESQEVDHIISFLLDYGSPQMHIVITTREDPNLPLARLRGRGQLTELRASDLRFTDDEAKQFLNTSMGLALSQDYVIALEERTEGWIVGLQLAAISMQNQADKLTFIENFNGNHQYVLDYLVEEVLQQQSTEIKDFLLQTSILDQFCADLCDVVIDFDAHSQTMLNDLMRANLFLIPLDNERKWFRYHHLFRELLRQRWHTNAVNAEEPHIRASQWYEEQGFELQAFQHAATINDMERVERLLEGEGRPLLFRGVVKPILNWLNALPHETLDEMPSLWIWLAFADSYVGLGAGIEDKLSRAETMLQNAPQDMKTQDLLGRIATVRAMISVSHNDIDTMMSQSQIALNSLTPDNLSIRVQAMWAHGFAQQIRGNREEAANAYHEVVTISKAVGNVIIQAGTLTSLGQLQESNNQLHIARSTYQSAIDLLDNLPPIYACEAILGLGRIAYQWNDLKTAERYSKESLPLALQLGNVDTPAGSYLLLAYVYLALQDMKAAKAALNDAQVFVEQHHFDHMLPLIAACQIQILLHQNYIDAAYDVADPYDLPISQARIELVDNNADKALSRLDSYAQSVGEKGWGDELLKARILQALAYYRMGDKERALTYVSEALGMAERNDFARIFIDEGQAMQQLLSDALANGVYPAYTQKLLASFQSSSENVNLSSAQPLLDPLSEREIEVLALIAEGLTNQNIADRLYLSLHTIKVHARNIYSKLDVSNRTQAVAKAKASGLIS